MSCQSKRKTREPKEETVTLGPTVREGEHVFGVAHVFASFNDTFIVSAVFDNHMLCSLKLTPLQVSDLMSFGLIVQHVTDLSGRETLVRITGTILSLFFFLIIYDENKFETKSYLISCRWHEGQS